MYQSRYLEKKIQKTSSKLTSKPIINHLNISNSGGMKLNPFVIIRAFYKMVCVMLIVLCIVINYMIYHIKNTDDHLNTERAEHSLKAFFNLLLSGVMVKF